MFKNFLTSFKTAIASFVTFIRPVIIASAEELKNAALAAVLTQVPKLITGEQKFNIAVNEVLKDLSTRGKTVAVGIAQQEVQYVYDTYIKNKVSQ